ncbi:hypothetical protein [Sinorhizobium meliloti]|uniref:hypothetical protein n=1 Tax=Rhizobium meliloti TaxID=382 RepID=UPI000FD9C688|nr:hypothetical protein [Sinorhizobium meliloti]MDX0014779.1 hypothetical protein [Sinorhizobium meliloti]MDX0304190.1 hypothetical protein [Sinorhizobium meliloti]RVI86411.1 hypothetical protein CN190_14270 [Sinorhizobium meliloti]
MKFKTFSDAFTAECPLTAANDNEPRKARQPRYRGTLPALRWLFDSFPELAPALAAALPKPSSNWSADAEDNSQEIRPAVGELMKAASDAFRVYVRNGVRHVGAGLVVEADEDGERINLGSLKFRDGLLVEWGSTAKGHKLRPVDRVKAGSGSNSSHRSPQRYLETRATTPSPMQAASFPRNVSDRPVLPPMLDPQAGVEANRELLRSLGVDGSVSFDELPAPATKCETAVAKGAGFLGGISRPSGNSSSGAQAWEAPEVRQGEVASVVEEVAARGTLKSIGLRLGYAEGYADRAGKAALIEAAKTLAAANDNKKVEPRVPIRGAM